MGLPDAPSRESRKYREARPPPSSGGGSTLFPPGRISLAVSETRPISFPFHLPPGGQWLFVLPSLPPTALSTHRVVPERVGNTGHTTGILWTLWANLCPQAQREGSCQGLTSGMSSIP